jgi:hypothetical protein
LAGLFGFGFFHSRGNGSMSFRCQPGDTKRISKTETWLRLVELIMAFAAKDAAQMSQEIYYFFCFLMCPNCIEAESP